MADRIVFGFSILALVFWLGMEVGAEKSAVALKPCPMQDSMRFTGAVDTNGTRTCYYKPIPPGAKA